VIVGNKADPANDTQADATERRRLTGIYRWWSRESGHYVGSAQWHSTVRENLRTLIVLLGIGFSIIFTPFDLGFWVPLLEPFEHGLWLLEIEPRIVALIQALSGKYLATALMIVYLVNGWLLDGWLRRNEDPRRCVPRWLRGVRFLVGGIPVLGLLVLPAWPRVLPVLPSNASAESPSAFHHRQAGRIKRWASRFEDRLTQGSQWLMSPKRVGVLFLSNCVVLFVAGSWLSFPREPGFGKTVAILFTGLMLHGMAFSAMTLWLVLYIRHARLSNLRAFFTLCLSVFWLIPLPYLAAFTTIFFWLSDRSNRTEGTLLHAAFEDRNTLQSRPVWSRLKATLRGSWARVPWWRRWYRRPQTLDTPARLTQAQKDVRRFCRRKCLALAFEVALLTGFLVSVARWQTAWAGFISGVLSTTLIASLLLGTAGVLLLLLRFAAYLVRSSILPQKTDQHAWITYLIASQFALAAGMLIGVHHWRSEIGEMGRTLQGAGILGLLLHAGPILMRFLVNVPLPRKREMREEVPWLLLFAALYVFGSSMAKGEIPGVYRIVVELLILVSPVWSFLLGAVSLAGVLRPFKLRYAFDRELPARFHGILWGLVICAVAPLGGVLSPVWIVARERWWSEYEERWFEQRQIEAG